MVEENMVVKLHKKLLLLLQMDKSMKEVALEAEVVAVIEAEGGLEVDSEADSGVEAEVVELAVVVVNSGERHLFTYLRKILLTTHLARLIP